MQGASGALILRGQHENVCIISCMKNVISCRLDVLSWSTSCVQPSRLRQPTNESCCIITTVGRHARPVPWSLPGKVWCKTYILHGL